MYQVHANTPLGKNLLYFVKWTLIASLTGVVTGLVGTAFGHCVSRAGDYFMENRWTIWLLPVSGLLIVWIYHLFKEDKNTGRKERNT